MEFRCESCEHVGAASSVTPRGGAVLLVCANCGHENVLDVGGPAPAEDESVAESAQLDQNPDNERFDRDRARSILNPRGPTEEEELAKFREDAMARLVPEPGVGPRCPKCVHLMEPTNDFCGRCGLNVVDARKYGPGEAPWEKPPEGKETVWEQAKLLWDSLEDDWTEEKFRNFAAFVREEGLLEFATRKIKWRLVEEPEDEAARELLSEIASELQSRIMVARARAKANVEQFSDVTQRAKSAILWTTLVVWLLILLILVAAYAC